MHGPAAQGQLSTRSAWVSPSMVVNLALQTLVKVSTTPVAAFRISVALAMRASRHLALASTLPCGLSGSFFPIMIAKKTISCAIPAPAAQALLPKPQFLAALASNIAPLVVQLISDRVHRMTSL